RRALTVPATPGRPGRPRQRGTPRPRPSRRRGRHLLVGSARLRHPHLSRPLAGTATRPCRRPGRATGRRHRGRGHHLGVRRSSPPPVALLRAAPQVTVPGHRDPNLANYLWDGQRVRVVDLEDAAVSDPATGTGDPGRTPV